MNNRLIENTGKRVISFVHVYAKSVIFLGLIATLLYSQHIEHLPESIIITLQILITYLGLNLLFHYLRILLLRAYLRKHKYPPTHYDNLVLAINKLSIFAYHIIFIFLLFGILGVQITTFLTSISIFAVALVLIFREYIVNFINGTIVMFSKDIKLGNYVKVGDVKGRITDINFLNTELKTDEGDTIFVPNSTILTKEVVNYSKSEIKTLLLDFSIDVKHGDRTDVLEKLLREQLVLDYVALNENFFTVNKIEKETMLFTLRIPISSYKYNKEQKVRNICSRTIIQFMNKKGRALAR